MQPTDALLTDLAPDDDLDPDAIASSPEDADQVDLVSDDTPDHDPFVDGLDADTPPADDDDDDDIEMNTARAI